MAEQWIAAITARDILEAASGFGGATRALCHRAHNGLIKSKAQLLVMGEQRATDELVPPSFWWAKGEAALTQNWATGDFSTWIDHRIECRAFGVTFALGGILEMLPVELRAETQRRLSVAGQEGWVSAAEAAQLANKLPGVHDGRAYVLEQARLGLLQGSAVLAERFSRPNGADRTWCEREWSIPTVAWEAIVDVGDAHQNWDLGQLSAALLVKGEPQWLRLSGVHVLADTLSKKLDSTASSGPTEPKPGGRPPQPWWDDLWCHTWALVYEGKLIPKAQADIEAAMHAWVLAHGQGAADSTIRLKAQKLYRSLTRAENSPAP